MNRTTLAALALLLPLGLTAGCAPQNEGNIDNTTPMSKSEAMASAKRVSGPSTDVCNIPYDSDGDGINDSTLVALGEDDDDDGLAVIPINPLDIFADGQYGCSDTVLNGFIVVTDATIGLDCSDTDATIGEAGTATYPDGDGDLYGDSSAAATMVCSLATGDITDNTDCDDTDAAINPAATEVCNGVDDNCAGGIDDGLAFTDYYTDADSDGDGAGTAMSECADPGVGFSLNAADCDDTNSTINLAATEVCNGVDDNCDTVIDTDATDQSTWYVDGDSDFYGDPAMSELACDQPLGYVADNTDCADSDAAINPGATEILDNSVDEDCSGVADMTPSATDTDGDGYDAIVDGGTDCDDTDALVNPGMAEVSLDGVDNDCDGLANASDTVGICAAPSAGLESFSWQLWLRDVTVYPDGNSDVAWDFPGYAQGIGTLCADFTLIDGNILALNGPFDIDGDGQYGEEAVDGDGVWAYMDVVNVSAVTGDGYPISLTNTSWGAGSNGESVIDLL